MGRWVFFLFLLLGFGEFFCVFSLYKKGKCGKVTLNAAPSVILLFLIAVLGTS